MQLLTDRSPFFADLVKDAENQSLDLDKLGRRPRTELVVENLRYVCPVLYVYYALRPSMAFQHTYKEYVSYVVALSHYTHSDVVFEIESNKRDFIISHATAETVSKTHPHTLFGIVIGQSSIEVFKKWRVLDAVPLSKLPS